MLTHEALTSQIEVLTRELARVIEAECQKCTAGMQARIEALSGELDNARTLEQTALAARQGLAHDLEKARKRIATLTSELKEARQESAAARTVAQQHSELRQQVAALQGEVEQERSIRRRLEKGAAADERRLQQLESALAAGPASAAVAASASGVEREIAQLQGALQQAVASLEDERAARQGLEQALDEADRMIAALEKALKSSRKAAPAADLPEVPPRQLEELMAKLGTVEGQLQQEQLASRQAAAAYDQALARIAELEEELSGTVAPGGFTSSAAAGPAPATSRPAKGKPLPHEVRPAPKPGARFHPDWELSGLPCRDADQVALAWNSVANVQLSLEGYPAQYCAAFLVVLKQGRQKRLYLLFNLKSSKHTLVCVPDQAPGDEATLNKQISEARQYLQTSGFELEKIAPGEVAALLGGYFRKE